MEPGSSKRTNPATDTLVWITAFVPIAGIAAELFLISIDIAAWWSVIPVLVVNSLLSTKDKNDLVQRIYDTKPLESIWATFFVPVYLFKRVAVVGGGYGYAIVWIVTFSILLVFPSTQKNPEQHARFESTNSFIPLPRTGISTTGARQTQIPATITTSIETSTHTPYETTRPENTPVPTSIPSPTPPPTPIPTTYFTIGSHKDDVLVVQGTPTSVNKTEHAGEWWHWGNSYVIFDLSTDRIVQWGNPSGNLKVELITGSDVTQLPYFTSGSHRDDVIRIQGMPDAVTYSEYAGEWWHWDNSYVTFDLSTDRINFWGNHSGNLKVELITGSDVTQLPYFTFGSHRDDVIRIQGMPDSVTYSEYADEWWHWGNSYVIFDLSTGRIISWGNGSGNLQVDIISGSNVTGLDYFEIGSHMDDVLRIQGMPTDVSADWWWWWGNSHVTFDLATKKVLSWENTSGNLNVRLN
jgi:hypothetical protein